MYSLTNEASVTSAASEKAIGRVFSQEGHHLNYVSKKLSQAEQNYCSIEREALAIAFVVRSFEQFLIGKRFTLQADSDETHLVANATETAVRTITWWPGISQNVLRYVSKCKECQENMPSLGKTVSTWSKTEI